MEAIRGFDSLYQLLPPVSERILQRETGDRFSAVEEKVWPNQYSQKILNARETHKQIFESYFPSTVTIYGTEVVTSQDYLVDQDFEIIQKIPSYIKGDGTVSMASATLSSPAEKRIPIREPIATHDQLPNHPSLFKHLETELSLLN